MNVDKVQRRVKNLMPELEIKQFDIVDEGLFNEVVIVNDEYVFRFARTEKGSEIFAGEKQILDLIRPTIGVNVPTPTHCDKNCMIYPYIYGKPLLLDSIKAWDEQNRRGIAESLAKFLYNLHSINISQAESSLPDTLAPVKRDRWIKIYTGIKETVYPQLWKHQVQWAEGVFEDMLSDEHYFDYQPVLIHGDLRPYHILINDEQSRVTGIIDFGVAGIGDPASDFGTLINTYGESYVLKMKNTYPDLERFLKRARFYAQALELHWFWLGIESRENFWFGAHLGCARDINR